MKHPLAPVLSPVVSFIAAAEVPNSAPKIGVQPGHAEYVRSVAFSPDGTLFASGSNDNSVKIWDVASRRELRTLTGHTDHVLAIRFSSDGTLLATLGYDKTVRVWEVRSGQQQVTINAENGAFKAVAFAGKAVLTAN